MNTLPATGQVFQGQPPPAMVAQSHGSVGTVVGVVAAIAVLGVVAGVIGRLCGRRSIMGYGGHYDIEEWAEAKCSSCIDGNIGPPPTRTAEGGGERRNAGAEVASTGQVKTEGEERERESLAEEEQEEREGGHRQNHPQTHSQQVDAL